MSGSLEGAAGTGTVLAGLAALEAACDGPIPAAALQGVLLGGAAAAARAAVQALRRAHGRAAAGTRTAMARRRAGLSGEAAAADPWLARLGAALQAHRAAAVAAETAAEIRTGI